MKTRQYVFEGECTCEIQAKFVDYKYHRHGTYFYIAVNCLVSACSVLGRLPACFSGGANVM